MIDLAEVTLAVLAGGAGRRMGGPKAWLMIDGESILNRLLRTLAWSGPTLLVTSPGREHPPGNEQFDLEVCDAAADQGPLRGILTALTAMKTPLVIVVPVDMPGLEIEPLAALIRYLIEDDSMNGVCYRLNEMPQPLPAALRRGVRGLAEMSLRENQLSLRRWYDTATVRAVTPAPDISVTFWHNLNEPEDLTGRT